MIKKEDLYIRDPLSILKTEFIIYILPIKKKMNFILLLWYTNQKI